MNWVSQVAKRLRCSLVLFYLFFFFCVCAGERLHSCRRGRRSPQSRSDAPCWRQPAARSRTRLPIHEAAACTTRGLCPPCVTHGGLEPCPTPQEQAGAPSRAHGPAQMQSILFHPLYIVVGPTESHRELQGGRVVALGMWDWTCLVAQPRLSKHRPADTAPPRSQRYRCLEGFQDTQQFPARSS